MWLVFKLDVFISGIQNDTYKLSVLIECDIKAHNFFKSNEILFWCILLDARLPSRALTNLFLFKINSHIVEKSLNLWNNEIF